MNTSRPAVGGAGTQGKALTADPGTWQGSGPVSYTYQWQRCDAKGANCHDIPGATDDTYVPAAADVGHTLRAVITATTDAGATTTASAPTAPVVAAPTDDLSAVPGTLLAETSCQQLVGGAKYRRVALAGIGTVRVRAYTSGPALRSSPLRLTTEISGGRAKSVSYRFDGRAVGVARGARHPALLTPSQLGRVGVHTLSTAVRGSRGRTADRLAEARDRPVPDPLHRAALADHRGRRAAPAHRLAHRAQRALVRRADRAAAPADDRAPRRRLHPPLRGGRAQAGALPAAPCRATARGRGCSPPRGARR